MERFEIKRAALCMRDTSDLRSLLNRVKRDALGDKAHPFHLRQITYYSDPRRTDVVRYKSFTIPKKSGGVRAISAPVAGLKSILTSLNTILQAVYEPTRYAMGFVEGRSVVDNARVHLGQNYVFNIDLEDFFPSIDKSRVWKRLTLPPFNFPSELADVVAGLCTMRVEAEGVGEKPRYVLPQGAPTSPTISNIICEKLDRRLAGLAKRFGAKYSRYADDITFSSMTYIYSADGEFMAELRRIIADNRFTLNEKKTRLQKVGQRQEVTGLVLSDRVNVARTYTRELRTMLHIWDKYGSLKANVCLMRARNKKPMYRHKWGKPSLDAIVRGKLNYLKMVKGEKDSTYRNLYEIFEKCHSIDKECYESDDSRYGGLSYLSTMDLWGFGMTFGTLVEYNPGGSPELFFLWGDYKCPVSVSRNVPVAKLFEKTEGAISMWHNYELSLCDDGSTRFFLLHRKLWKNRLCFTVDDDLLKSHLARR